MITLEQIQKELLRYKYKPNTTITARSHYSWDQSFELVITAYVPDIKSSVDSKLHSVEVIRYEDFFNAKSFEDRLLSYVQNLIHRFEYHEFKEWFQYDSECVYNPHPELS